MNFVKFQLEGLNVEGTIISPTIGISPPILLVDFEQPLPPTRSVRI